MDEVRQFETGATRDTDSGKLDYEAFFSPAVMERYAEFMHKNRFQRNGKLRDGDNWQKGIPRQAYMKSLIRHVMELWLLWRDNDSGGHCREEVLCAIMFNAMGNLFEILREKNGR